MGDWLTDYYHDVDTMNMEGFINRHADDVEVHFANNPPARGKAEVSQAIGHFWEMIDGLKHNFVNVYKDGDTTILEAAIDYKRKDGGEVTLPCTTILHRDDGLVDSVRIFIDLAPVFAPAAE